jgi:hypothetical protein
VLLQGGENSESPSNPPSKNESAVDPPVRVQANPGKARFVRGALDRVDCSPDPSVILTVVSGSQTLKMKIADKSHVVLIGADKFSCSWSKQKVAVNYREGDHGEINIISLEIVP